MTRDQTPTRNYATPLLARTIKIQGREKQWIAKRAGIKPPQLSYVLTGRRSVTKEVAQRIADSLGADVTLLFESRERDSSSHTGATAA